MSKPTGGATRIIKGVNQFQQKVFETKEELFQTLRKGQKPLALFITCSDSRINPNLLTSTEPGELFILRNAGNIVPPASAGPGGEEATIEYAILGLKVRDIIICGHSHCGAVHGLLAPAAVATMPRVASWLTYAKNVASEVEHERSKLAPEELLNMAVERNVLLQTAHLRTHAAVAQALAAGNLRLHSWVYRFETGEVLAHDPAKPRFVPLAQAPHQQFVKETPKSEKIEAEVTESM